MVHTKKKHLFSKIPPPPLYPQCPPPPCDVVALCVVDFKSILFLVASDMYFSVSAYTHTCLDKKCMIFGQYSGSYLINWGAYQREVVGIEQCGS